MNPPSGGAASGGGGGGAGAGDGGGGKTKARMALRLKEAIGAKSSSNESSDLVALTERFNKLKVRLRSLGEALKAQHGALVRLSQSRAEVAKQVAALAHASPLSDAISKMPNSSEAGGGANSVPVTSFLSVHASMAERQNTYLDRFLQFVVNYAVEWERVVVQRVTTNLKQANKLRVDLDHYQSKVESLRQSTNTTMSKGKLVDPKTAEKLARNEEKLSRSRTEYLRYTSDLCAYMDEVTDRAWIDLHPLVVKLAQFDSTLASDEAKVFSELDEVVRTLKAIGDSNGIKPHARLKDLESLGGSKVSTRSDVGGMERSNSLAQLGPPSVGSGALITGAVMGGSSSPLTSPVASEHGSLSRSGSFYQRQNSGASTSTAEMLSIAASAAPPPTMDMVNAATAFDSSSKLSIHTGMDETPHDPTAPAPAAPPPPPPPPVGGMAGLSMYSTPDLDLAPPPAGFAPAPAAPDWSQPQNRALTGGVPANTYQMPTFGSARELPTTAQPWGASGGAGQFSPYAQTSAPLSSPGAASAPGLGGSYTTPPLPYQAGPSPHRRPSTNPFDE